ncbi:MAG: N-acetylglucosamine-6-phosphate deacetylase [Paenibacillaceae bacterium ZCTH02-B3]|nr:MAG: N-acetylglucosamine-6-phosphate deacetylase [Paenibacillaceae bacterium ZCTH02-B3]
MKGLWIRNANVYLPDRVLAGGSVYVSGGRIARICGPEDGAPETADDDVWDAGGLHLVPGFVDLHVHGGGGADVMDAAEDEGAIGQIARFHAAHGTTSWLATTMTAPRRELARAVEGAARAMERGAADGGAEMLGLHLEGPFLNPRRCGAQNPAAIRPFDRVEMEELLERGRGAVRLVTLAPECGDALRGIGALRGRGVTVSIGHSEADAATVRRAIEAGASHVTHLFNAMNPLHHREPGIVGTALIRDELTVELICDGFHVHPDVVRLVFSVKRRDRIALVTDAIAAAGMPDGDGYWLGGLPVIVKEGKTVLRDGGNLAGSCLTMDEALKRTIAFTGLTLAEVLPALTLNPARQIGADDRKGSIEVGKDADLVVLGPDLSVVRTFVGGVPVHG